MTYKNIGGLFALCFFAIVSVSGCAMRHAFSDEESAIVGLVHAGDSFDSAKQLLVERGYVPDEDAQGVVLRMSKLLRTTLSSREYATVFLHTQKGIVSQVVVREDIIAL